MGFLSSFSHEKRYLLSLDKNYFVKRYSSQQQPKKLFLIPSKATLLLLPVFAYVLIFVLPSYTPKELLEKEKMERKTQ